MPPRDDATKVGTGVGTGGLDVRSVWAELWYEVTGHLPGGDALWLERYVAAVSAVARAVDWASIELLDSPIVWVFTGTITGMPAMVEYFGAPQVECVAFEIERRCSAQVVEALQRLNVTGRSLVTTDRARSAPVAFSGALCQGVFVKQGYHGAQNEAYWESLLAIPVACPDDENGDTLLVPSEVGTHEVLRIIARGFARRSLHLGARESSANG